VRERRAKRERRGRGSPYRSNLVSAAILVAAIIFGALAAMVEVRIEIPDVAADDRTAAPRAGVQDNRPQTPPGLDHWSPG
jgi:hypothetical protein